MVNPDEAMVEPTADFMAAREQFLDEYGAELEKWKDECIEWRKPFEGRWIDAETQKRDGTPRLGGIKDRGGYATTAGETPAHKRANDNVTKVILLKNIARAIDMLLPTDAGESFDIEPSPVDDDSLDGVQVTADQADAAAKAMEDQVKDYLIESDFAGECRMVIDDGFTVGTGILHGPFPKRSKHRVTKMIDDGAGGQIAEFVYAERIKPAVERIDYRMFYPRPARTMDECEGVFLLYMVPGRKLREWAGKDGFDPEQIARLLEKPGGADPGLLADSPIVTSSGDSKLVLKNKYPVWKYVGQIKRKCECLLGDGSIPEDLKETDTVPGEVWFSMGVTIKAAPYESDDLPFHVFNFQKDHGSIFGHSLTEDIRDDQSDINLAWGAMKLNAMASAFPIVGILKGAFETENGTIEFPPTRPIILKGADVNECIQINPIPSTIRDISTIYERAKLNANEHGMVQSMEESAPANAQIGVGMFAMIKAEDNVVQARTARNWDDNITKPLLRQMIAYELMHGTNQAAKGTFDVIPKASTNLLSKEIQLQNALQILTLADNPANEPYLKRYESLKIVLSRTPFAVDQVMNSEEEVAAIQEKQAQAPNPEQTRMELERYKVDKSAEIAQMKAETDLAIARMRSESEVLLGQMTLEAANIKAASDETKTETEAEVRRAIAKLSLDAKAFQERLKDERERERDAGKTAVEAEKIAQASAKINAQVAMERPFRV
ncbi:MAG: hypothetical protein AB7O86_12225 [Porticoccaceae bacterium]